MTKIISVEEIGLCRSGPDNDIDLQAVFGGIKDRQEKGLKVNPLYDNNQSTTGTQSVTHQDINGNINNVHVVTYKSIPEPNDSVTSNYEGVKDSNGNEKSSTTTAKINGISSIAGKNGSIKRSSVILETQGSITKSYAMPVNIGKVELNGNNNDISDKTGGDNAKYEEKSNHERHNKSSNYQLLAYNNEGYTVDETDIYLGNVNSGTVGADVPDMRTCGMVNITELEYENISCKVQHGDIEVGDDGVSGTDVVEKKQQSNDQEIPNVVTDMNKEEIKDANGYMKSLMSTNSDSARTETCINTFTRTASSYSSASEQSVKTEIVTQVHVHSVESNQNQSDIIGKRDSLHQSFNDSETLHPHDTDTTDVGSTHGGTKDERQINNINTCDDNVTSSTRATVSVAENNHGALKHIDELGSDSKAAHLEHSRNVSFSTKESEKQVVSNGYKTNTSSTRTFKSILSASSSKQHSPSESPKIEHVEKTQSSSEIQEYKSVTFAQDTDFNENKSKRFKLDKMEKLNLRNIYHGKISSDSAVAKMNPLFQDDPDAVNGEKSMSEDERIAYQIALKAMMKSTKGKGKKMDPSAYKDHYLILKANGIRPSNIDQEGLQGDIEQPAYDRLIQRTIAKERRKLIVKWTLVIVVVAIITAVATVLGVYFKENG